MTDQERSLHTRKLIVIHGCMECPNMVRRRTPNTGYADDLCCKAHGGKKIRGYVEYPSEYPVDGEFPDWCPLFEAEPGMYE